MPYVIIRLNITICYVEWWKKQYVKGLLEKIEKYRGWLQGFFIVNIYDILFKD